MPPESRAEKLEQQQRSEFARTGELRLKRQYRTFRVDDTKVDKDARTVELSFSSEAPVRRWYGNEILSHATGAVRLARLKDSGPLLFNHDFDRHIGVVESDVKIEGGKGRAVVRFGNSPLAEEKFRDVQDKILRSVSVGYDIHEMELTRQADDGNDYTATDWEPYEISLCPAGADPSVGVGRDAESNEEHVIRIKNMTPHTRMETATMPPTELTAEQLRAKEQEEAASRAAILEKDRKEAREHEQSRVKAINTIAQTFQRTPEEVAEAVSKGTSEHDFRVMVMNDLAKRGHFKLTPVRSGEGDLGLTDDETRSFSFVRALRALANPDDKGFQEQAAFEREVSAASVKASHREIQGVGLRVPFEILQRSLVSPEVNAQRAMQLLNKRALNASQFSAGGALVATDLLTSSFIELLRKANVLEQLGATSLTGLVGDVAIPRMSGASTAYWITPEGGDNTPSQQAFDQLGFTPKTLGAYTEFTRQLLMQSSLDVEGLVRMDLAKVMGLEQSRVCLYGSGADGQPRGIFNTTGIATQNFAAANVGGVAQPSYPELVAMETALGNADVVFSNPGYAVSNAQRGYMKTALKVAAGTYPVYIWEQGGEVNGYRTAVSNQVLNDALFFANWADLVIAMWGGFDLIMDPYTKALSGGIRVIVHQSMDIGVRHPQSFCVGGHAF
jgi:HK97 family phage major capsid protein/HK97 family phage prohead protease